MVIWLWGQKRFGIWCISTVTKCICLGDPKFVHLFLICGSFNKAVPSTQRWLGQYMEGCLTIICSKGFSLLFAPSWSCIRSFLLLSILYCTFSSLATDFQIVEFLLAWFSLHHISDLSLYLLPDRYTACKSRGHLALCPLVCCVPCAMRWLCNNFKCFCYHFFSVCIN